jgi:hypothetical protein
MSTAQSEETNTGSVLDRYLARLKEAQERTARSAQGISTNPTKQNALKNPPLHPLSFVENANSDDEGETASHSIPAGETASDSRHGASYSSDDDANEASEGPPDGVSGNRHPSGLEEELSAAQFMADFTQSEADALVAALRAAINRCADEPQESDSASGSEQSDSE